MRSNMRSLMRTRTPCAHTKHIFEQRQLTYIFILFYVHDNVIIQCKAPKQKQNKTLARK